MSTLFRARVVDAPTGPLGAARLRADDDVALLVRDGVIVARGPWSQVAGSPEAGGADVVDVRDGLMLPGFVDTHVHLPQVRVIGGLGRPLLDWLEHRALPEEARMADRGYAEEVAGELLTGLASAGTTTALVFGAHFADAVDALFAAAEPTGLRITAGLVTGDRLLRPELHRTPRRRSGRGSTSPAAGTGADGCATPSPRGSAWPRARSCSPAAPPCSTRSRAASSPPTSTRTRARSPR